MKFWVLREHITWMAGADAHTHANAHDSPGKHPSTHRRKMKKDVRFTLEGSVGLLPKKIAAGGGGGGLQIPDITCFVAMCDRAALSKQHSVHGTAVTTFEQSITQNLPANQAIGRAAAQLCAPGAGFMLDGGTTTLHTES